MDDFLTSYDILNDAGTISAKQAKEKAYAEYDRFRLIQDMSIFRILKNNLKFENSRTCFIIFNLICITQF